MRSDRETTKELKINSVMVMIYIHTLQLTKSCEIVNFLLRNMRNKAFCVGGGELNG